MPYSGGVGLAGPLRSIGFLSSPQEAKRGAVSRLQANESLGKRLPGRSLQVSLGRCHHGVYIYIYISLSLIYIYVYICVCTP